MTRTICAIAAIAGLLFANTLKAQEKQDETAKKKKKHSIVISNKGIRVEYSDSAEYKDKAGKMKMIDKEKQGKFSSSFALMDLGVNLISDNTNYADPSVQHYLNVPSAMKTKSLFDLRTGKSINVNIYPWMLKYHALKTKGQRIYIATGIGLQLYNFRFDESISYTKNPSGVILDTVVFKKNKLAMDYLNVPLMLTFKTRISKNNWLIYGVGITEGYRIGSLNKQVSGERGKVKTRGSFGLADFNTCINAEFGVEGIVRFFASYQLTSLYGSEAGLDQHPICFGFRLSGI